MQSSSPVERADRISRRRARLLPVLGILFIAGQPLYFANIGYRLANLRAAAWLAWALVLLAALAFAGGRFAGAAVRDMVEDEVSRSNRLRAYATGFWAASLCTVTLFAFSLFDNLKAQESLHIILTAGIGAALLRFGALERRALADG
ncbi:MAG: hypothetical protein QOJ94_1521 [Sphingomonadales bacterium]|jgi:hypothetical protein|nr:hypothetical protein [Sphingomonadales bacterium]